MLRLCLKQQKMDNADPELEVDLWGAKYYGLGTVSRLKRIKTLRSGGDPPDLGITLYP